MGGYGYKVYRIKGRCYAYYDYDDYYADERYIGLQVLDEIPHHVSKEEFEEWVEHARCNPPELDESDDSMDYVSDKQPKSNGLFDLEWIVNRLGQSHLPYRQPTPISFRQHATR